MILMSSREKGAILRPTQKSIPKSEFYLTKGLTQDEINTINAIYQLSDEKRSSISDILQLYAERNQQEPNDIVLRPPQTLPVLASYISKRFLIGDEPGLGKTVMSAACYAYYSLMSCENTKVMIVTDTVHVVNMAKEWTDYGIKMLPLTGGSTKIEKQLETFDFNQYNGIVIGWSGLLTNSFLEFYMTHHQSFNYAVFDETSKLKTGKGLTYEITNALVNEYGGGIPRVLFLNGTPFESEIYDIKNQFDILVPKLIPSKKFLDDRYVVKQLAKQWRKDKFGRAYAQNISTIIGYQNQEELAERLKYYFITRNKSDYANYIPKHQYNLHVIHLTSEHKEILNETKSIVPINSPKTTDPDKELTLEESPKLQKLLRVYQKNIKDRPIIYVWNTEAQKTLSEILNSLGIKTLVLNGMVSAEEKREILRQFNEKEIDCLVFNVQRAANIPTSNRIIFYDIPTMPSQTSQIKARIDRNNYSQEKHYDFLCYFESPEWLNLSRLGYFREDNANKFMGSKEQVYADLINQMNEYLEETQAKLIEKEYQKLEDPETEFKDIEDNLKQLLNITGK